MIRRCYTLVITVSAPEKSADAMLIAEGAVLTASCSSCHLSREDAMADISGWSTADLSKALTAYKTDVNGSTVMHRLARGYSDVEIDIIANYIGEPHE